VARFYTFATGSGWHGWMPKNEQRKVLLGRKGMPDGDFVTNFEYPSNLQPPRRATGHGLYALLGIGRQGPAAREVQMRRNFEFFVAPTAVFVFVHSGLRETFEIPAGYKLICGVSMGYASSHPVNQFNPGRASVAESLIPRRLSIQ
jgi:hypothetical protein